MNMDGDGTFTLQDTIRSLIREELSQGLGDFKERAQESVRQVLFIELPRAGLFSRRANEKSILDPPNGIRMAQQVATPPRPADAESVASPLRQITANSQEPNPPGFVALLEGRLQDPRASLRFSAASSEFLDPQRDEEICGCGNVLRNDALFCQKCGTMRGKPEKCFCGAVFMNDWAFCNRCGRERPSTKPGNSSNKIERLRRGSTLGTLGRLEHETCSKAAKKRWRPHSQVLFKQMNQAQSIPSKLQLFTTSKYYEFVSAMLILANAVYLGWETQYLAERARDSANRNEPLPDPPGALTVFQTLFCIAFAVELGLRWRADGFINFFQTHELSWNVLDVVVVGASILELLLDIIHALSKWKTPDTLNNISVIRMLRVLRVVRVARVIRVSKFFRELRLMIYSIYGGAKNLVWLSVVLLMTFYIFGVGFTSAVTSYLDSSHMWHDSKYEDLLAQFGTVDRSLLSLFMAMSGGDDWIVFYESLELIGMPFTGAFLRYIVFTMFAVVNIVTGVFIDSTQQSKTKDRTVIVHEEMEQVKEYLKSMAQIFNEMDEENKGKVTLDEFDDKLSDPRVIAYFRTLKLDVSDARVLFSLIDFDHSGEIDIDDFLDGCYRLQGESSALDMKIMQYEVRFLHNMFLETRGEIEHIQRRVKSIAKALNVKKEPLAKRLPLGDERPGEPASA